MIPPFTEPMTDAEIAKQRFACEQVIKRKDRTSLEEIDLKACARDLLAALAEVERLRTENEATGSLKLLAVKLLAALKECRGIFPANYATIISEAEAELRRPNGE